MRRVSDMQSEKNVVDGNLPRIPQCGAPVVTVSFFFPDTNRRGEVYKRIFLATKGVFQSATHDAAGTSGVVPRTGVASGSERGRSRGVYLRQDKIDEQERRTAVGTVNLLSRAARQEGWLS